ncbi:gephyrin-like molybdotransferase receptor GlpR [Streptomyces sp. NPDC003038]|uniref:divisome protein SepX/GlpR n=1 Tax=Streptomyces sp. NPDC003038 TaxID=3154546 RepID=UPI0033A2E746
MSSSGLIYAVIVGAWAAYLVPMWLRRQDELNEARPTERFSTAIRLLSGRAGMERRYAKGLRERGDEEADPQPHADPDAATETVNSVDADARALVVPPTRAEPRPAASDRAERAERGERAERARREQRLQVLARRRRTTALLFLIFTVGAVVAAVGGLGYLWAPAVPALLLSTYIVHLRVQERRRYEFTMDRRRAEAAARHLRENRPRPRRRESEATAGAEPDPAPPVSPQEADRRALVEQTDHAEWVDQQRERERGPARGDSWEPVPVPLPTYVTAPVAPRATGPATPDAWSATRSSAAEPTDPRLRAQPPAPRSDPKPQTAPRPRGRDRGRTPLFDQYESDDRPRAANE